MLLVIEAVVAIGFLICVVVSFHAAVKRPESRTF